MSEPTTIELYADLHCPYAHLTAYRLRRLRPEWRGQIRIVHRSLALEYVNRRPTPKPVLDNETPILMLEEPDIPYRPWHRPDSEWPVTMWPAFEAIKCAERQDFDLADDLAWAIRVAFFADSRCISLRHVLLELAESVGLEPKQFADDFDGGVTRRLVLQEAQAGWEQLRVEGSPTFVLPGGEQRPYPGLPKVKLDEEQHCRLVEVQRPAEDGLAALRQLIAEAHAASSQPASGR